MKLIEIGKDYKDYVNLDFLVRLYKKGCYYYCELTNGITYRVTEDTYQTILNYAKETS
jgi:hypothetical protein